jgi:hypothetical protein
MGGLRMAAREAFQVENGIISKQKDLLWMCHVAIPNEWEGDTKMELCNCSVVAAFRSGVMLLWQYRQRGYQSSADRLVAIGFLSKLTVTFNFSESNFTPQEAHAEIASESTGLKSKHHGTYPKIHTENAM